MGGFDNVSPTAPHVFSTPSFVGEDVQKIFGKMTGVWVRTGGESGIRTHGRVSPTHAFQACSFYDSYISPGL